MTDKPLTPTEDRKRLADARAAARCMLEGHTWARRTNDRGKKGWRCVCCHQWQPEGTHVE